MKTMMREDGLYEKTFLGDIASVVAQATMAFLMTVICLSFAAQSQTTPAPAPPATTSTVSGPVSSPNDINKHDIKLSELATLRVQNKYKDAMLASAEVQRIQAAVLAASPDVQRAQAAFQKAADEYNQLVTKEAKEANLPEGSVITVDPATKEVSIKEAKK